jgi:hypothetical protein
MVHGQATPTPHPTPPQHATPHLGTVVTNPKLNKTAPNTPAWDVHRSPDLTAGMAQEEEAFAGEEALAGANESEKKHAVNQTAQQRQVKTKATDWMTMLSSRLNTPMGTVTASASKKPRLTTVWQPHALNVANRGGVKRERGVGGEGWAGK